MCPPSLIALITSFRSLITSIRSCILMFLNSSKLTYPSKSKPLEFISTKRAFRPTVHRKIPTFNKLAIDLNFSMLKSSSLSTSLCFETSLIVQINPLLPAISKMDLLTTTLIINPLALFNLNSAEFPGSKELFAGTVDLFPPIITLNASPSFWFWVIYSSWV